MIKQLKDCIILFTFTLTLFSCANITAPSGGPPDTTPPELIKNKSYPIHNTLNFRGKTVELAFSEDISTQTLEDQLLITPTEENPYKVSPRRNRVILTFEKEFSPNTTYTFNFRQGIKDITENNPAQNLILAFSTGDYLDSISVQGTITDLKTNKPAANIVAGIFKITDSITAQKTKPLYFALTGADGKFSIQNIKDGSYNLYAWDDANKNLIYEETEKIAFRNNLQLNQSQKDLDMQVSVFDSKPPQIRTTKSINGIYEIQFNEGVKEVMIQGENKNDLIFGISPNGRNINIYDIFNQKDSIPINIQLKDSMGNDLRKEMKIIFQKEKNYKEDTILSYSILPGDGMISPPATKINLLFTKPLTRYELSKLILLEDSIPQTLKPDNFEWIHKTNLQITKPTKAQKNIQLILPEKTFTSLKAENRQDTLNFQIKNSENYGSMAGRVETTKESYILELLDRNYQVVEQLINPKTFNFTYLNPGTYYLRAIIDENKNQKWDQGNLMQHIQPEQMIVYKEATELRSNWEIVEMIFKF